jgi:hypothetical protein
MLRSFHRLTTLNPGFQSEGLLTMRLALPSTRYRTADSIAVFHDTLYQRIRALPAVSEVGATSILPLSGPTASSDFTIAGQPPATENEKPSAQYRMIDASYFRAMRVPMLRGREFTERDRQDRAHVVIISEALAKSYWKGRDPVGTHILLEDNPDGPRDVEVVGGGEHAGIGAGRSGHAVRVRADLAGAAAVGAIRGQQLLLDGADDWIERDATAAAGRGSRRGCGGGRIHDESVYGEGAGAAAIQPADPGRVRHRRTVTSG